MMIDILLQKNIMPAIIAEYFPIICNTLLRLNSATVGNGRKYIAVPAKNNANVIILP